MGWGGGGREKPVEHLSRSIFFPPPDSMLTCPWARHRTLQTAPGERVMAFAWQLPPPSLCEWMAVCVCVQAFKGSKQMQSIYGNSRGAVLLMVMIMSHEQRRKAPQFRLISFFKVFFYSFSQNLSATRWVHVHFARFNVGSARVTFLNSARLSVIPVKPSNLPVIQCFDKVFVTWTSPAEFPYYAVRGHIHERVVGRQVSHLVFIDLLLLLFTSQFICRVCVKWRAANMQPAEVINKSRHLLLMICELRSIWFCCWAMTSVVSYKTVTDTWDRLQV